MPALLSLQRFALETSSGAAIHAEQISVGDSCVVLRGDWSAWFDLLSGKSSHRGELLIAGEPAPELLRTGKLALALSRAELPLKLTVGRLLEYRLKARRPELDRARLRSAVAKTLKRCRLERVEGRRLKTLSDLEQRVVRLALADVVEPDILAVEEPFFGLGSRETDAINGVLDVVGRERALIVSSLGGLPEPGPLLMAAAVVLTLDRGQVRVLSSEHAPGRLWHVTTISGVNELAAELSKAGAEVSGPLPIGPNHPVVRLGAAAEGGALRVCLPETASPLLVFRAAAACDAVVIELMPAV